MYDMFFFKDELDLKIKFAQSENLRDYYQSWTWQEWRL